MPYTGSGEVSSTQTTKTENTQAPGLRRGASGPAVKDLQQRLGDAGFDAGPVDGSFGPKTEAGVRAYQQAKGLEVDGVVTPDMTALLGEEPKVKREVSSTGSDLEAMALKKHGPEFVQKVQEMSERLGVKSDWVFAVMKNESGMSPSARNPNGGASGLIQFMPSTAKGLGTTTTALRQMSAVEQLKYVEKYYAPFKGKINSGADLYLATFYPAGVGKSDGYGLGGSKVANANPIFDLDRNGQITAGEFRQYYANRFPELA
jgi:peptidoglycan hydrolase-like protein with peptidoglycan-binding domain